MDEAAVRSMRELKGRIRSIVKIRDVTRAMKTASAGKYRKAVALLADGRLYVRRIEEAAARLGCSEPAHPAAAPRGGKPLLVLISSDRGLCGGFNTALFRTAEAFVARKGLANPVFFAVGRKADDWCRRSRRPLAASLVNVTADLTEERIREAEDMILRMFDSGSASEVHLLYNEFRSLMDRRPSCAALFPAAPLPAAGRARLPAPRCLPGPASVRDYLLPRCARARIRLALLESNAAEQAARMTTMDSATRNADDLLDALKLDYQKARQLGITRELADLTTGAEAMK